MTHYHNPVMLTETIDGLGIQAGKTYVDITYGGGGHAEKILEKLGKGRLIALDQDADALKNQINDERLVLIKGNFRYLKNYLKYYNAYPCDGILADLGISSFQIDCPERGFSTRYDGPLDFRMNKSASFTGEDLLNEYGQNELTRVFRQYGEVKNAPALAAGIIKSRGSERLRSVSQFKRVLSKYTPARSANKYLAKVFQAIRIEVNQEMQVLEDMLLQTPGALKPGGRLVVIAYHSLEDRLVKNLIRSGNLKGELQKDFYGEVHKPFNAVNNKPVVPSSLEIRDNPRARSAKLRVAERNSSEL
ncbi:MAG: 16S rRNA (cytosine(1402)-N(4))-methyltransferase RsmH [Bacteroidales bacterium]